MNNKDGQSVFFQIAELHLDGKVMVEDVEITGFIIPQFITIDRKTTTFKSVDIRPGIL